MKNNEKHFVFYARRGAVREWCYHIFSLLMASEWRGRTKNCDDTRLKRLIDLKQSDEQWLLRSNANEKST